MIEDPRQMKRDIRNALEGNVKVSPSDHRAVEEYIERATELEQEVTGSDAFRRFCHDQLRERDEVATACGCSYDYCDLKQGRLPAEVRRADNLATAIDEYLEKHPEADILLELRQRFRERYREYLGALREARITLREAVRESKGEQVT